MRRERILAALALLATPALAADCMLVAPSGASLNFTTPMAFEIRHGDDVVHCTTSSAGTGLPGRIAHCEDGFDGLLDPVETSPGSGVYDGTRFRDAVWTRMCSGEARAPNG